MFQAKKIYLLRAVLILMLSLFNSINEVQRDEIPYSQFIKLVQEAKIDKASWLNGWLPVLSVWRPERIRQTFATVPLWQNDLAQMLAQNKVDFVVRSGETGWLICFQLGYSFLIIALIWSWIMRRATAGRSLFSIGQQIRIHQDTQTKITFADVAGADSAKQELKESIDFLKAPEKIQRLGDVCPKACC